MTRAKDFLGQTLIRLKAIEDALEQENALNPDLRLSSAEIAVHLAIADVQRILAGPAPGEAWDCAKRGHQDTGGMFAFTCRHCDYSEHT